MEITESFLFLVEGRIEFLADKYEGAIANHSHVFRFAYDKSDREMAVRTVTEISNSDPSRGKYLDWILKQILVTNSLIWPEDADKVRRLLDKFHNLKNKKGWDGSKDINDYPNYSDLSQVVRSNAGVQSNREKINAAAQEGLELFAEKGEYRLYKVTTIEAGLALGWRETEWCVTDPMWFDKYEPPFWCLVGPTMAGEDMPIELWHKETAMLMDVDDDPVSFNNMENMGFHEPKETIMASPDSARAYASQIIDGPWPEAEPAILLDIKTAWNYLIVTRYHKSGKQRWPEFEEKLLNNSRRGEGWEDEVMMADYARMIIKGRWPEAEDRIARISDAALAYASDVIKGRWPKGEAAINSDSATADQYARLNPDIKDVKKYMTKNSQR